MDFKELMVERCEKSVFDFLERVLWRQQKL